MNESTRPTSGKGVVMGERTVAKVLGAVASVDQNPPGKERRRGNNPGGIPATVTVRVTSGTPNFRGLYPCVVTQKNPATGAWTDFPGQASVAAPNGTALVSGTRYRATPNGLDPTDTTGKTLTFLTMSEPPIVTFKSALLIAAVPSLQLVGGNLVPNCNGGNRFNVAWGYSSYVGYDQLGILDITNPTSLKLPSGIFAINVGINVCAYPWNNLGGVADTLAVGDLVTLACVTPIFGGLTFFPDQYQDGRLAYASPTQGVNQPSAECLLTFGITVSRGSPTPPALPVIVAVTCPNVNHTMTVNPNAMNFISVTQLSQGVQ